MSNLRKYFNRKQTKFNNFIYIYYVSLIFLLVFLQLSCFKRPILASSKNKEANKLFNQGEFFFKQADYPTAIKYYHKAEKLNPKLIELNHKIGLCYAKTRFYEKAKNYFLKELSLNPENLNVHLDLGVIYSRQGKINISRKEYLYVLKKEPNNYKAHLNLGVLMLSKFHDHIEGIKHLNKYIELAPYSVKKKRIKTSIELLESDKNALKEIEKAADDNSAYKTTIKRDNTKKNSDDTNKIKDEN